MPLPIIPIVFALVTIAALPAPTHAAPPWTGDGSGWTEGVMSPTPIANEGVLPPMVDARTSARARANLAASRNPGVRRLLEEIGGTNLGRMRKTETRALGLERLRALDDPGFLYAMPEVFAGEAEDVRRTVVEHLAASGPSGQAALAWTAIHGSKSNMREACLASLRGPAAAETLAVLQTALRGGNHETIDRAGRIAGVMDAWPAIPHLVATQYSADRVRRKSDLAWIAIGTQRSYVQNLIPVTGDGSGAFQPVIGQILEGFVMRVMDAVVVIYRTEVHRSLIGITSRATGADTSGNGWSFTAWRDWYNDEFLATASERAADAADASDAARYAEAERRRRDAAAGEE